MLADCPIIQLEDGRWRCPYCGETNREPFKKNCPVFGLTQTLRNHRGLGDTTAAVLAHCGVTKKSGCDCTWRQQFLNAWFPYKPAQWKRLAWKVGAIALWPLLILLAAACSLYQWRAGQWRADRDCKTKTEDQWRQARERRGTA